MQRAYERYIERIGLRPAPMYDDYAAKIRKRRVDVIEHAGEIVVESAPRQATLIVTCDENPECERLQATSRMRTRGSAASRSSRVISSRS